MFTMIADHAGRLGVAALLALVSTTVFAQSVSTNYVPGTDFSKYHTYKWVPVAGAASVDQILEQEIKQAVDTQLAAKSLEKKDADPVDLYVGYQVGTQQEHELNFYGGPGWRFGGGMASVTTQTVDQGTLVIDLYDPAAKQLIWRGSATETVHPTSSPEKKQESLDKAMAKLLKNFPPKAK